MQSSFESEFLNILSSIKERSELSKDVELFLEGRSLAQLMEAGLEAKIADRLESQRLRVDQNCLLILDEILPRLPQDIEEFMYSDVETEAKHQLKIESPYDLVRLVDASMLPFLNVYKKKNLDRHHDKLVHRVFIKMLRSASMSKLMERVETSDVSGKHLMIMAKVKRLLRNFCPERNRVGTVAVMTLTQRVSPDIILESLSGRNIHVIRNWCKFSKRVRAFYETYDLEKRMFRLCRKEEIYLNILQRFSAGDVSSILELIDSLEHFRVDDGDLIAAIFTEHLSPRLGQILDGDHEDDARAFLELLINFKWTTTGQYSIDVKRFEKLVRFVTIISRLKMVFKVLSEKDDYIIYECNICEYCVDSLSTGRGHFLLELLIPMMTLLHRLYRLNCDWHRWFDIVVADPLIDSNFFKTTNIEMLPDNLYYLYLRLCPAATNEQFKLKLLTNASLSELFGAEKMEIVVRRESLLRDFVAMSLFQGNSVIRRPLDVAFEDEKGSGFGTSKEYFSLLSKEFQRHDLEMWLGEARAADRHDITRFGHDLSPPLYTYSPGGLYPRMNATERSIRHFYFFGLMMACAFINKCNLDIPLSVEFFKFMFTKSCDGLTKKYIDVARIMPGLANFIKDLLKVKRKKMQIRSRVDITEEEKHDLIESLEIEDGCAFDQLDVSFVVPGTDVEMKVNGANIQLDSFNVEEYLDCLGEVVMNLDRCPPSSSVKEAFRKGFDSIFPIDEMAIFTLEELQVLFCGIQLKDWTVEYLMKCLFLDQGYKAKSRPIKYLLNVMSKFNVSEKRMFLRFVTGVPTLDLMSVRLTVARVKVDNVDLRLPHSATCTNTLFLPEYSSVEITRDRLLLAITEGRGSFDHV